MPAINEATEALKMTVGVDLNVCLAIQIPKSYELRTFLLVQPGHFCMAGSWPGKGTHI